MSCITSLFQDLGSIVTFLRICKPLEEAEMYKRLVLRPLKDGDPRGAGVLRVSITPHLFSYWAGLDTIPCRAS